jgi:hypothetical protein
MKNDSKVLRAFYIILVPVVLLMILLNSGWLQRWFTAVTVCGEDYNAVRYNYYYFSVYQDFIESDLTDVDYDVSGAAGNQQYDENTTWKEHFIQLAEERLVLAAYYNGLAEQAGYEFSEEELAPVAEKLGEITALCDENGVKERNYYPAYYGAGMDVNYFTQELTYEVQGQAYRAYLESRWEASQTDIDAWLADHPATEEHPLAELWLLELDAVPDRTTGEVGARQINDLTARLDRLAARDGDMASRTVYADALWGTDGLVKFADRADLPDLVADWAFADGRQAGDVGTFVDEAEGRAYLAQIVSLEGSSAQKNAQAALCELATDETEAQVLEENPLEYHSLGMQLATA